MRSAGRRHLSALPCKRTGRRVALAAVAGCLASCGPLAAPALAVTGPSVSGIEANNGPAAGGATVVISGQHLAGATPVTQVFFGARPSPKVIVVSETAVTALAPAGSGEVEVRVANAKGETSPDVPRDHYAYDPPPRGPWLGLNGNSSTYLGALESFVEHKVVFDRSAAIEWSAKETLKQGGPALALRSGPG